ncbi:MAG: Bifunctional protein FolD protein [Chlamydiales bacterium]|nr:Bifunctional protein FolD protein [Chlamydiales bacterium]MCH9620184.1 Bifunctional protein FolD protein [Chlamydiales bacterium]MCH9623101.1 Bifunctional protein FolD protein [Chlamydiales bacterium]
MLFFDEMLTQKVSKWLNLGSMHISGKKIADKLLEGYRLEVERLGMRPKLAVVLVGKHAPSEAYVRMKEKACSKVGVDSPLFRFPENVSEKRVLDQVHALNQDSSVHGILVQLPLPEQIDESRIIDAIDPKKDVDGFHPVNLGKLLLGEEKGFIPCTPLGVQVLLEESKIATAGKHVVIVGRSNIVGKPLAALLMQKKKGANATVTVVHSQTENLSEITRSADILIAAMGKPRFIRQEMVKEGAVVIDVGISRVEGKLIGDVDFESVSKKCQAITPVPGGVGPMTVAMLIHNTIQSFQCC